MVVIVICLYNDSVAESLVMRVKSDPQIKEVYVLEGVPNDEIMVALDYLKKCSKLLNLGHNFVEYCNKQNVVVHFRSCL